MGVWCLMLLLHVMMRLRGSQGGALRRGLGASLKKGIE